MAPNNALADHAKKNTTTKNQGTSRTTVLAPGTVEARGTGTKTTNSEISAEIHAFLTGEAKFGLRSETRAFFTVWTFITRLPGPTWVDHHPGYLMRGMAYFPLAGSLVGFFVSCFYDLARTTFQLPSGVSAALCTVSSLWMTGCFHEDGLADASDGIGGGWSRVQILKIMTDTRLGTYGCAVLVLYLVAKVELLRELNESHWEFYTGEIGEENRSSYVSWGAGPALLATHTLARLTSPFLLKTRTYVDEAGPKYKYYSFMVQAKHLVTWHRLFFATLYSFALTYILYGPWVAATLVTAVFAAGQVSGRYGEYILGGVMGDYLGATICVTELWILVLILFLVKRNQQVWSFSEIFDAQQPFWEDLWDKLDEKQKEVLLRFVCMAIFTTAWCSLVGHPDVLIRENAIAATDGNGEDDNSQAPAENNSPKSAKAGLESSDKNGNSSSRPALQHLQRQLQTTSTTFTQRYHMVRTYIDTLAKPVGSLGTLEDWAARLAALHKTVHLEHLYSGSSNKSMVCLVFAANHGVAASKADGGEGCSNFDTSITSKVVEGLERGLAGAAVLAKCMDVQLQVVDVGVLRDGPDGKQDRDEEATVYTSEYKLPRGTKNFCLGPAMTSEEVDQCMLAGRRAVTKHHAKNASMIILGEVGIGNTTSSSALVAALTNASVEQVCGAGSTTSRDGKSQVDVEGVQRKVDIVKRALIHHNICPPHSKKDGTLPCTQEAKEVLAKLGGAEIAALVGAMLEASDLDLPVMVDGFIVTTAAMVAALLHPPVARVLFFATKSTEVGQEVALQRIKTVTEENQCAEFPKIVTAGPALDMGLRLGEATGGILAVALVRGAVAVLHEMSTIDELLRKKAEGS